MCGREQNYEGAFQNCVTSPGIMFSKMIFILCLCLTTVCTQALRDTGARPFRFASYYTDHLVLQRAPQKAGVWGYAPLEDVGKNAFVILVSSEGDQLIYRAPVHKGPFNDSAVWSAQLDPISLTRPHTIVAKLAGHEPLVLRDVLFGDVWLCSGQSNMQFTLSQMFGFQGEMADAKNYDDIRLFNVQRVISEKPLYDVQSIISPWSLPGETFLRDPKLSNGTMDGFSAVCYMFGKFLRLKLGYPIGLIDTTWGGTPIEAWSDEKALAKCGLDRRHDEFISDEPLQYAKQPHPHKNTLLWNSMIHPFVNMTIKGAIWYQGEANTKYHTDSYNCSFPAMIESWRSHFSMATGGQTPEDMPFGFVQIGPNHVNDTSFGYPIIRWHQMMDNVRGMPLKNTFMAVAMDLADLLSPYGQVHIRDKITVAKRLSNAALNIIYHEGSLINNFPFPTGEYVNMKKKILLLEFSFGLAEINVRSHDGFEVCCSSDYGKCSLNSTRNWVASPIIKNNRSTVQLSWNQCQQDDIAAYRYSWRDTPCEYHRCAIYSDLSGDPLPTFSKSLKN